MGSIEDVFAEFTQKEEKKEEKPKEEKKKKETPPEPEQEETKDEGIVTEKITFVIPEKKGNEEFDLSPAETSPKHVITIYGLKGAGKTSLAFSFPVTHACLSFDKKSTAIRDNCDKKDAILVFDGSRYLDKSSPEMYLESAERSWRYLNKLLDTIKEKPDWVVVDGGEVFHTMAEMVMRYRNNIMPFQGVQNRNLWKERRMYIDQLLRKCIDKSKKGVIWTCYLEAHEIIKDGEFIAKEDVPRYIDAVLQETDSVIKVERETGQNGQQFFATIETSKWKVLPETPRKEITGKGITSLIKGEL